MTDIFHDLDSTTDLALALERMARLLVSTSPRAARLRILAPVWCRLVRQSGTPLALGTAAGSEEDSPESLRSALPGLDALVSFLTLARSVHGVTAANPAEFAEVETGNLLAEVLGAALSILLEDRVPVALYASGLAGIFVPSSGTLEDDDESGESAVVGWRLNPGNLPNFLKDPLETLRRQWRTDGAESVGAAGPVAATYVIASMLGAVGLEAILESEMDAEAAPSMLVYLQELGIAEDGTEFVDRVGFRVTIAAQDSGPRVTITPLEGGMISRNLALMLSKRAKLSLAVDLPATVAFDGNGATLVGDAPASVALRLDRYSDEIEGDVEETQGLVAPIQVGVAGSFDGASGDWDLSLSLAIKDVELKIGSPPDDGFLSSVLPSDGLSAELSFGIELSRSGGLRFRDGGLSLVIHTHILLPAVTITQISLGVDPSGPLRFWGAVSAAVKLGPVEATITGMGVRLNLDFDRPEKNLGFVDADLGFQPPSGIGIAIDADIAKGGGFLDIKPDIGRYSGVFDLTLLEMCQVSVIAVIDTKMPDGSEGFSFLALLFAQFNPGIELGFAFNLKGVGGMVGIHRTMDFAALESIFRERRSNALLFPEDPVKNAATLMADLGSAFPVLSDHYVFGPAIRLAWGYPAIFTASLGVFLEFPGPLKLLVLGELSCVIPDEQAPLVEIHIDVMGRLDLGGKTLAIDGSLRASKIVGINLYGDMALRLSWGDNPEFGLSIGGFHPQFTPPADFPPMKRLGMGLSFSEGGVSVSYTREIYFAITSNTLQFGAKDELTVDVGGAGLHGWISFDAILHFSPFSFQVDFDAGLKVWVAGITIASMHVHGLLAGPNPWRVAGEVSVSLLFFDVSFDFDVSFGERQEEPALTSRDPLTVLLEEAGKERNWRTSGVSAPSRTVVIASDIDTTLVAPDGVLAFSQKKVPLGEDLDRFEEVPMGGTTIIVVGSVMLGEDDQVLSGNVRDRLEQFAPAQFREMTDAEKLSSRPFKAMRSGFAVAPDHLSVPTTSLSPDGRIDLEAVYETRFIDQDSDGLLIRLVLGRKLDIAGPAIARAIEGSGLAVAFGASRAVGTRIRKAVA